MNNTWDGHMLRTEESDPAKKVFIRKEEEKQTEAGHSSGDEMSQRRMLHGCRNWRINMQS